MNFFISTENGSGMSYNSKEDFLKEIDRMVFDFSSCTPYALLGVAVSIAVCLPLAYACWYLVEKRLRV